MKQILIVVDMQKDFVDGSLGSREAEGIVENAALKIRKFDGKIFVTLDTHAADYLETAEGKKLPVPHCIKGTDGWRLTPRVLEALSEKGYTAVEKNTFGSVELAEKVKAFAGTEALTIELIGLCTDICVVSNALLLKAYLPEARICVDAGCCAGVTAETHKAAIETMKMCQIEVIGEEKVRP